MNEIPNLNQGDISQFPPIIKLNVGGVSFSTTRQTLTNREPESMLARMFSGLVGVRKDESGRFFIDRDGTHFRFILNYLRDGSITNMHLLDDQVIAELKVEAAYYSLTGLVSMLEPKTTPLLNTPNLDHLNYPFCSNKSASVRLDNCEWVIHAERLCSYILQRVDDGASKGEVIVVINLTATAKTPEAKQLYKDSGIPSVCALVYKELTRRGFNVRHSWSPENNYTHCWTILLTSVQEAFGGDCSERSLLAAYLESTKTTAQDLYNYDTK